MLAKSFATCAKPCASLMQGAHQLPQKFTTTILPRRLDSDEVAAVERRAADVTDLVVVTCQVDDDPVATLDPERLVDTLVDRAAARTTGGRESDQAGDEELGKAHATSSTDSYAQQGL